MILLVIIQLVTICYMRQLLCGRHSSRHFTHVKYSETQNSSVRLGSPFKLFGGKGPAVRV